MISEVNSIPCSFISQFTEVIAVKINVTPGIKETGALADPSSIVPDVKGYTFAMCEVSLKIVTFPPATPIGSFTES